MILSLLTAPVALPVELDVVKAHLRVDTTAEDPAILAYLAAAVAELDGPEGILGRCLAPQTWRLQMAGWAGPVRLGIEPVRALTITYLDPDGARQTLDPARWELAQGIGSSPVLYFNGTMPQPGAFSWPVRVDIEAGAEALPADIRAALLMRCGDLYAHREAHGPAAGAVANPAWDALIARARRHI